MKKIISVISIIFLGFFASAQKKSNPVVGKNEFEISLFHLADYSYWGERTIAGVQAAHRWSWKKNTKIGAGLLVALDNTDLISEEGIVPYGALFGDVSQLIGKRQKWMVDGQVGHGVYIRQHTTVYPTFKVFDKFTAGIYYAVSAGHRFIITKKLIVQIGVVWSRQVFKEKKAVEDFSTSSVQTYKDKWHTDVEGLKIGIVF